MAGRPPCGPPGMGTQNCSAPSGVGDANVSATGAYVVNSKIMVVAVAVLFAVVVFILCLHVYAKWFWRHRAAAAAGGQVQARTGSWRWRRGRRDVPATVPLAVVAQSAGLDKAAIESLPTFEFDATGPALECAVCLEAFSPGEKGRTLPKCAHHFHLDCVDMWLHSHSTCPLCRAPAQPLDSKPYDSKPSPASRRQRARSLTGATIPSEHQSDDAPEASAVDAKALAPGEIPSNVLFWGDVSGAGARPSASSIRAPFHVTIDIPRQAHRDLHPANVVSPIARASASFRRLLSRGKSVVSPHDDDHDHDAADEGGPSSHSPRTPPP